MGAEQVRPAQHVLAARQGDLTVLLDPLRGRYYSLGGAGAQIWAMLQEGIDMGEIARRLAREYEVPRDRIDRDLRALLDGLRRRDLVS